MGTRYREGSEQAFERLRRKIDKVSIGQSTPAAFSSIYAKKINTAGSREIFLSSSLLIPFSGEELAKDHTTKIKFP